MKNLFDIKLINKNLRCSSGIYQYQFQIKMFIKISVVIKLIQLLIKLILFQIVI